MLVVRDVEASSRFYVEVVGLQSGHGGAEYERLYAPGVAVDAWSTDGLVLQLHAWDEAHHHGHMGDANAAKGNGVLVWFEIDGFDAAAERVRASKAELVLDVHWNPNARHREIWFRDLDGYTVVLASHVESEPAATAPSA